MFPGNKLPRSDARAMFTARPGRIKKRAAHSENFLGGLVSSAIKYDCFKLDDSGNCIIRKTWLHCI